MFTLAVFAFFACVVLPACAWMLRLVFRVFGWTMRLVFGVLLMPLWIVLAVMGGLAFAVQAIIPIALIAFVVSLFVPES
ncbi:MAG: hypothetical protein J6D34_05525 [Atopobiaceae bacterium]|nr:hypothetical protein [Atopobiaceae bacterium]